MLQALGYQVKSDLLGIEVIYQSLKENELDAFLGYWDPAMQTYADPYEAEGSVERVGVNLPMRNTLSPFPLMWPKQASGTSRISRNSQKSSARNCMESSPDRTN